MTQLTTISGQPVAPFSFGTMQFGGTADAAASRAMYDAARGAGIAHFDTAWVYADGASETLLGQMIAPERDDIFVASKVGYTGGAGRANMLEQFDTSRRRLQQDVIDLLYLHRFDPGTDLSETLATFAALKDSGAIRHVGLSNFAAWQVMKAQMLGRDAGVRIDVIQPMYNLAKRQAEVELLPMCADQGIAACTYSPLGGGLLTGKYLEGGTGRLKDDERYAARYGVQAMHEAARGLSDLAGEVGTDPATLAVAWVAAHPADPHPIISARSVAQLAPSLAAMTFDMSPAVYTRIGALMPAPPPATDRLEEAG